MSTLPYCLSLSQLKMKTNLIIFSLKCYTNKNYFAVFTVYPWPTEVSSFQIINEHKWTQVTYVLLLKEWQICKCPLKFQNVHSIRKFTYQFHARNGTERDTGFHRFSTENSHSSWCISVIIGLKKGMPFYFLGYIIICSLTPDHERINPSRSVKQRKLTAERIAWWVYDGSRRRRIRNSWLL